MTPTSNWGVTLKHPLNNGSYKWGYNFPNMGYKYIYLTYNPMYDYP